MASIGRLVDSPITTACRGGSMRVLHVSSGNLYGGIETLLLTLARHRNLCPGLEQHFALCFEGRLSEELAAVGARVHLLGNVRVRKPLSVWRSRDRKSTRLNSSHSQISYAVFCLKKKKKTKTRNY